MARRYKIGVCLDCNGKTLMCKRCQSDNIEEHTENCPVCEDRSNAQRESDMITCSFCGLASDKVELAGVTSTFPYLRICLGCIAWFARGKDLRQHLKDHPLYHAEPDDCPGCGYDVTSTLTNRPTPKRDRRDYMREFMRRKRAQA